MVKLTGPGLAQQAAGAIAGDLIFSTWKGKSYLKKHRSPKQPRTPAQIAMRAIMTFLAGEWAQISAADKLSWSDMANAADISPFNAYQSENLARWRNYRRPSKAYPATEIGDHGTTGGLVMTGLPLAIRLRQPIGDPSDLWGNAIHLVAGNGQPLTWDNLVFINNIETPGWYDLVLRPFTAGTRWLAVIPFTYAGDPRPAAKYGSCVVLP